MGDFNVDLLVSARLHFGLTVVFVSLIFHSQLGAHIL